MPRVADYTIIADGWVADSETNTVNFDVPANIDPNSRCILGFMLKVHNVNEMTLKIFINDTEVWNWHTSGHSNLPIRFFQEVIPAGLVTPGANSFRFNVNTDDFESTMFSDIVLWWQANI